MSRLGRLAALAAAGREAVAFARQAWLLPRDTLAPVVPDRAASGEDVVVFVHGLFATAGVLRPLRERVARHAGVHAATFTYAPGSELAELVDRLAALVADVPDDARIHLVGHSLGGVVARLYAHDANDARVVQTISMAAPFAGVSSAKLLQIGGVRELDPEGALVRRLRLEGSDVPHLSIIAGADAVVRAPVSHALPGGDVIVLEGRGHNTLLYDDEAIRLVERRVLERRARSAR